MPFLLRLDRAVYTRRRVIKAIPPTAELTAIPASVPPLSSATGDGIATVAVAKNERDVADDVCTLEEEDAVDGAAEFIDAVTVLEREWSIVDDIAPAADENDGDGKVLTEGVPVESLGERPHVCGIAAASCTSMKSGV